MSESHSSRRCPGCGAIGRMYRSHSRSAFERFMHAFSTAVLMYRCHQCNWRGYMFRALPTQSRAAFWLSIFTTLAGAMGVVTMLVLFFSNR